VIQNNPLAQHVLNQIYTMDLQYHINIDQRFREHDHTNQGIIKRESFLAVIEQNIRSLQREEITQVVDMIVPPSEGAVNYGDFMKILYMFGEKQGQQQMMGGQMMGAPHHNPNNSSLGGSMMGNLMGGMNSMNPGTNPGTNPMMASLQKGMSGLFDRMKASYSKTNIEEELRKKSTNNDDQISAEALILSLSQVKGVVNVQVQDINEFVETVTKVDPKTNTKVVSIGETLKNLGVQ
jgi:hypothetical protein